MKKILKIIALNIIGLLLTVFICDVILFGILTNGRFAGELGQHFKYSIKNPFIFGVSNLEFFLNVEEDKKNKGRIPDGLQYKGEPVVLFGCSYAYGEHLLQRQTFGRKLSDQLKRPVYNRGIPGGGLQYMYWQSNGYQEFYNQVPKFNTVIYVMINDQYRRIFGEPFKIIDPYLYLHYEYKNDDFIMDNYENYFLNLYKSSYTLRLIRNAMKNTYIKNPKNADKLTDLTVLYFIKSKEYLENNLDNKLNFYVILYDEVLYSDILKKKLENEGFNVIETSKLTDIDLKDEKYTIKDDYIHPNEEVWNILTPKIAEIIKNK